jgi:hypothetical protein
MKAPLEWAEARLFIDTIKRLEEDVRPHSSVAAQLLRMAALEICEVADDVVFSDT